MSRIDLLTGARESLALSAGQHPIVLLIMAGLFFLLIWAARVAGATLIQLFRAAMTAAVTALAVVLIPVALIALLFLIAI